jgi:hypothetical protein
MQSSLHFLKHMDEDRYKSAKGWEPRDPYKKQREKAWREYESQPKPGQTMLDIRPASHWIIPPTRQKPRREFYGPMWREGEVCLLFGPKGVGKSLFAVQLAEDLATGQKSLTDLSVPRAEVTGDLNMAARVLSEPGAVATGFLSSPRTTAKLQRPKTKDPKPKVLLIDFEQTTAQFTERYTYPSPIPGKLPCRTRFHFQRASISEVGEIPACFKGSVHKYLQHSIGEAIAASEAQIVILDSINYLFRGRITANSMTNVLKTLKLHAQTHQVSILATAGARTPPSAHKDRHAHLLQLATLADSAILLAPSTYGPQYRYTKLLATRSQVPQNLAPTSGEVLTYQLNEPRTASSPPYEGGVAEGRGGSLFAYAQSPFTFLGPSQESDHLRNYAAESEAANRAQESALKRLARRSAKQAVVDGFLDGSFRRYLLGE